MRITRRHLLRTGGILGASTLATLNTPALVGAAGWLLSGHRSPDFTGTRLVAILPGGAGPGQVRVRAGLGIAPGGPQAINATRDGRLAILDTLNGLSC